MSRRQRQWIGLAVAVVFAIAAVAYLNRPYFSDDAIRTVEASIKSEFQKRDGVTVDEVRMIRENDRKLKGFVKLTIAGLSSSITKGCEATLGDDQKLIWQCP